MVKFKSSLYHEKLLVDAFFQLVYERWTLSVASDTRRLRRLHFRTKMRLRQNSSCKDNFGTTCSIRISPPLMLTAIAVYFGTRVVNSAPPSLSRPFLHGFVKSITFSTHGFIGGYVHLLQSFLQTRLFRPFVRGMAKWVIFKELAWSGPHRRWSTSF